MIFITPEEMYHLREQKEVFAFLGGQLPEGGERFYVDVSDVCGDPVSENVTAVSYKLALVPLDPERTVYARASMVIVGRTGAMEIRSVNLSRRYSPVSEGGRDFADRLPEGIAMVAGLKQQGIRLVSHNSRIRVALGYGEEEFARKLRKNVFFMLTGDDQVRLSDAFCDPKDDRMITLEIHPRRKDKSIFRCEVRGSLFHVEDGVPMSVLVFRDVTEIADRLQSAEEQLEGLKLDSGRQIRRLTEDNQSLENRIILERESAVSAVKKESEEELERIRTESEQAMEKLRSESEETIAKLKDENSARLDETRLLAEKEMQETRMLAEREVEETRMLAEQKVEDIRRAAAEAHDILEAAFDCSPGETAVLLSSDGKTGRMMVHSRDLGSLLGLSEEELGAALERDLFTGFDISGVTRDILFRDAVMGSAAKGREFTLHRPDGSTSTVRFVLRREAVPEDAVLPAGFPGKAPEPEDGRDAGAGDASREGGKKDPLFYVFLTYLDVTEDAAARAAAGLLESAAFTDATRGIAYFRLLERYAAAGPEALTALAGKLRDLSRRLFTADNLVIHLTGSSEEMDALRGALEETGFLSALPATGERPEAAAFEPDIRREAFATASRVNYVARAGSYVPHGYAYTGALRVLKVLLSYDYLWNRIRVLGGAYGCMASFGRGGSCTFVSYRDPKLLETDAVYDGIPAYAESYTAGEREMTKAVIGAVSELDSPLTPQNRGLRGLSAWYSHVTDEMLKKEREQVLTCTQEEIRALAPLLRAALSDGARCAIGNEEQIRKNAEFFTSVEPLARTEEE